MGYIGGELLPRWAPPARDRWRSSPLFAPEQTGEELGHLRPGLLEVSSGLARTIMGVQKSIISSMVISPVKAPS